MRKHEDLHQQAIFEWAQYNYRKYPELEKLLFAIPNGGSRHRLEAINLKKQGVKAGISDITLQVARGGFHGLWIELKAGKNKAQPSQLEFIEAVRKQGYLAKVIYGSTAAIELIEKYLNGWIVRCGGED